MKFQLTVKVNPATSRQNATWKETFLKVNLTSAPERGRANEELLDYLANILDIPRPNLQIIRGFSNRKKTVEIAGVTRESMVQKIRDLPS